MEIPALREAPNAACSAEAFHTVEQDGTIWVWADRTCEPDAEPFQFPFHSDKRYTIIRDTIEFPGRVIDVAENALDVPHTAYLHRGLFRTETRKSPVEVVVSADHRRVEAEYLGEARPDGWLARALAPGGGTLRHWDRFLAPSIAQVEYAAGERAHLVASVALSPKDHETTVLFADVAARFPVPIAPVLPLLKALAYRVLAQDEVMLRHQRDAAARFDRRYVSSRADILGPGIARLMRALKAGNELPETTRRVTIHV